MLHRRLVFASLAVALALTPLAVAAAPPEEPMATATSTKERYEKQGVDGAKAHALVVQHNQGVIDDHVICAKLDANGDVNTTTYEAGLTALEIPFTGYTPTETAVNRLVHDVGFLTEDLLTDLVEQHNARVTDLLAVVVKLNADTGIAKADFPSTAKKIVAYGATPALATADKSENTPTGFGGHSGTVLQQLRDEHAALTQDWRNIGAFLDADGSITVTDFEAQLEASTLSQLS